jgi:hypothetical protein
MGYDTLASATDSPLWHRCRKVVLIDKSCLHQPGLITDLEPQTITGEQHLCSLDYSNGTDCPQYVFPPQRVNSAGTTQFPQLTVLMKPTASSQWSQKPAIFYVLSPVNPLTPNDL